MSVTMIRNPVLNSMDSFVYSVFNDQFEKLNLTLEIEKKILKKHFFLCLSNYSDQSQQS